MSLGNVTFNFKNNVMLWSKSSDIREEGWRAIARNYPLRTDVVYKGNDIYHL